MKKQAGQELVLRLAETPDVARAMGEIKKDGQIFVGFAAETDHVEAHAREKLARKRLDMIVANDVTAPGAGFSVDTNIATLITEAEETALPLMSKRMLADRILDSVIRLRQA